MGIASASFEKEICFIISAMDHPRAGENSLAPGPELESGAGRGGWTAVCCATEFMHGREGKERTDCGHLASREGRATR